MLTRFWTRPAVYRTVFVVAAIDFIIGIATVFVPQYRTVGTFHLFEATILFLVAFAMYALARNGTGPGSGRAA